MKRINKPQNCTGNEVTECCDIQHRTGFVLGASVGGFCWGLLLGVLFGASVRGLCLGLLLGGSVSGFYYGLRLGAYVTASVRGFC